MIPRRRGFRYRPRTDIRGNYIVRAEILSNERNGDTHHGAEWDYVTQSDPDALPTLVRLQRGRDGGEGMSERSAEKGAIALARCKATCSICGTVKNQIDASRERAEQVVRAAMERHYRDEHPEVCICCGEDSSEGPIDSDGNHWCGECPRDGVTA